MVRTQLDIMRSIASVISKADVNCMVVRKDSKAKACTKADPRGLELEGRLGASNPRGFCTAGTSLASLTANRAKAASTPPLQPQPRVVRPDLQLLAESCKEG